MIECLLRMHEVLGLIPGITKTTERKSGLTALTTSINNTWSLSHQCSLPSLCPQPLPLPPVVGKIYEGLKPAQGGLLHFSGWLTGAQRQQSVSELGPELCTEPSSSLISDIALKGEMHTLVTQTVTRRRWSLLQRTFPFPDTLPLSQGLF